MARYTYKEFEDAAKKEGLYDQFGAADLRQAQMDPDFGMSILGAKVGYRDSPTQEGKDKYRNMAESQRSAAGYSTDPTGNYAISNPSDKRTREIDDLVSAMQGKQFRYNPNTDPSYQAYRANYLMEGQRASQDTLAQAAAMTGGIPSSYAVGAAQQANNYYAAQAANKIPELEQQTYQRFQDDINRQATIANLKQQQQNAAWNQAQTAYQYGDSSRLSALGVDTTLDPAAWQRRYDKAQIAYQYGDSTALNALGINTSNDLNRQAQEQQLKSQEWQMQLQKAQTAAAMGDYSQLRAMGFNTTTANFDRRLQVAQILAQYTGDVSELYKLLRGEV